MVRRRKAENRSEASAATSREYRKAASIGPRHCRSCGLKHDRDPDEARYITAPLSKDLSKSPILLTLSMRRRSSITSWLLQHAPDIGPMSKIPPRRLLIVNNQFTLPKTALNAKQPSNISNGLARMAQIIAHLYGRPLTSFHYTLWC